MTKLSAVIITKNEEQVIEKALQSVSFCDEIVVVDNSSTDKTVEIAKKNNAKVFSFTSSDFAKSRNYALEHVTSDWILYVDADERVTTQLAESIKNIISEDSNYSAFIIKRKNFYLGKYLWPKVELLERLFKKSKLKGWYGVLHESPKVDGKIGILDGYLEHYTHRDLSFMLAKTISWSKTEAKLRYKANHPKMIWWRFPRVMIPTFFEYYVKQKGFRLGTVGLIESMYQMFSIFLTYARLWELQNNDNK